ncbi:DUF502 domain-containing protein [Halogeometricum luteum]|uniref:DUF502 domain-containing protein n=1 Tax=Halogeometricum luteum TaxID=2950537 RepID=A0ABU2G1K0_9EURY|nr:DUF502 domain-containing protein [Halogeometricum sp. S3BR5-2]MDS0294660.1 DUF502 domain-containing protein [Halogeometricum sp. S3BR5-2]
MSETEGGVSRVKRVRGSLRALFREALISGIAVIVPLVVTAVVVLFLFNAIYRYLNLLSDVVVETPAVTVIPGVLNVSRETMVELLAPALLFVFVLFVGLVVNSSRYGERAVGHFDYVMTQIPGVGSVYDSFRRMSDVMLDSDAQNFREVKLVEFPHEGAYTLGFVTTDTPDVLSTPVGHPDMKTLFLPLAPNPVMGGHLVHLPADRVIDVDMTVEEGIRTVVTSGVAVSDSGAGSDAGLSESQLRDIAGAAAADGRARSTPEGDYGHRRDPVDTDRTTAYDRQVDPEHTDTPNHLAAREGADAGAGAGEPHGPRDPPEARSRPPEERESTAGTPAEMAGRSADEAEGTDRTPAGVTADDARERASNDARDRSTDDARPPADRKRDGDGDEEPTA